MPGWQAKNDRDHPEGTDSGTLRFCRGVVHPSHSSDQLVLIHTSVLICRHRLETSSQLISPPARSPFWVDLLPGSGLGLLSPTFWPQLKGERCDGAEGLGTTMPWGRRPASCSARRASSRSERRRGTRASRRGCKLHLGWKVVHTVNLHEIDVINSSALRRHSRLTERAARFCLPAWTTGQGIWMPHVVTGCEVC